jgi:hypothetical protein
MACTRRATGFDDRGGAALSFRAGIPGPGILALSGFSMCARMGWGLMAARARVGQPPRLYPDGPAGGARSHCRFARPFTHFIHQSTKGFGASISETAVRANAIRPTGASPAGSPRSVCSTGLGTTRRGPFCRSALPSAVPVGVLHIDENGVRKNDDCHSALSYAVPRWILHISYLASSRHYDILYPNDREIERQAR